MPQRCAVCYICNKNIQLGLMFIDVSYLFMSSSVQNKIVLERNLNFKLATTLLIVRSMLGMQCSEMWRVVWYMATDVLNVSAASVFRC